MKKNILILLVIFATSGCVTMDLQPGMTIKDVNSDFWVYCNKGDQNGPHILLQGNYEYDPSIQVYKGNPSTKRNKGEYLQCEKTLYFKNGVLVSDLIINELNDKGEKSKRDLQERIQLKQKLMLEFISSNNLEVLDKFRNVDDDKFKVYVNRVNQRFYSKNYEFVDEKFVAIEVAIHEREEVERKERELIEKKQMAEWEAKVQRMRIEKELMDKKKMEQEQKDRQLQDKVNKLISENNLIVLYRDGTFLVSKNPGGQYFYIKDGVFKKQNEVKNEIEAFNLYQKRQIEFERQRSEIRERNLAYRWVVQAQAVCRVGTCRITGIREQERLEDGSVNFTISYQTWRGSAGSSGTASITCGFGKSNSLSSTSVRAVCQ
jgi:hypothetical protein